MMKNVKQQTKKSETHPALNAARKPLAPAGHPLSRAKPEERAHPAERKVKHKHRPEESE